MSELDHTTPLENTVLAKAHEYKTGQIETEPYLVLLSGPDKGKQFLLNRQHNAFGRADDVDIKISDAKVSRIHGAFIIYADYIVLEDRQSTNGCYVDNKRIERQMLELTSRIQVGNTLMKIEYKKSSEVEAENLLLKEANTDPLTNIPNRRSFLNRLQEEVSYCKRNKGNLTIVLCDVDHFKKVNDKFGHPGGDQVLKDLATILRMEIREEDMLARYGGEEFIMLLRNSDPESAYRWAHRVREKVEQFTFRYHNRVIQTTISIGVCSRAATEIFVLDKFIKAADEALYRAKDAGRNCVEIA